MLNSSQIVYVYTMFTHTRPTKLSLILLFYLQIHCPVPVMEVYQERQQCSLDLYGKPFKVSTHGTITDQTMHFGAFWWLQFAERAKLKVCKKISKMKVRFQACVFVSRCGPLFNTGFLRRMLSAAVQHSMDDIQPLVKTLICESECTMLKSLVHGASALNNQGTSLTSALLSGV